MPLLQKKYEDIRDCMRPGDVIAFSGKKVFSKIIKRATRSNISHVGVVLHTKLEMSGTSQGRLFNQIAEATASGVKFTKLSDIKRNHKGKLWWLPLLIYAAGHDHSLQVLEGDMTDYLIVSGAGSSKKISGVKRGKETLFACSREGFMVMDFFDDDTVLLRVVVPGDKEVVFHRWLKP